jgi:hypothetical protein
MKRSNTKTRVSGVNYRVEGKLYQETQETKNSKKKMRLNRNIPSDNGYGYGPAFGSGRGKSRTCHHDILRQTEVWTPDERFLTGSQEFTKTLKTSPKKLWPGKPQTIH